MFKAHSKGVLILLVALEWQEWRRASGEGRVEKGGWREVQGVCSRVAFVLRTYHGSRVPYSFFSAGLGVVQNMSLISLSSNSAISISVTLRMKNNDGASASIVFCRKSSGKVCIVA